MTLRRALPFLRQIHPQAIISISLIAQCDHRNCYHPTPIRTQHHKSRPKHYFQFRNWHRQWTLFTGKVADVDVPILINGCNLHGVTLHSTIDDIILSRKLVSRNHILTTLEHHLFDQPHTQHRRRIMVPRNCKQIHRIHPWNRTRLKLFCSCPALRIPATVRIRDTDRTRYQTASTALWEAARV